MISVLLSKKENGRLYLWASNLQAKIYSQNQWNNWNQWKNLCDATIDFFLTIKLFMT